MSISPEVFRDILFSLTGLSLGAALVALVEHVRKFTEDPRLHTGFILVKVGWFLVIGMLMKTIFIPISAIPPSIEGYIYGLGIIFSAIGFVLVSRRY